MTDQPRPRRTTSTFLTMSREGRQWAGLFSGCLSKPVVWIILLVILVALGVKLDVLTQVMELFP